jgi:hypothetical protein
VVEEAAAVVGILGGDDEAGTVQGDEMLEGGVESLAMFPARWCNESGNGVPETPGWWAGFPAEDSGLLKA